MISASMWKPVKLGPTCSKIGSGSTPRGGEQVYIDEGVALIRSQNVYNGFFTTDGLVHISDDHANELLGVTIENDDILLNITGDSVARCCQVPEEILPARVNQHVSIIRPQKHEWNRRFLMYYLISPRMQSYLLSIAGSGGTRKALTKEMIEKLEIPQPKKSIQDNITNILSPYDDLIENNLHRIKLLEDSARQLYKEWFVRLRFPGYEHTKIVNGVPEGWEKKTLSEISDSVDYGYTESAQIEEVGPKYLRITDIVPSFIDWSTVPYCPISEERQEKFNLTEGDLVIARTGATVGYAKRLHKRHPDSVFASYLVRFRINPDVSNMLIGIFVESDDYKTYVKSRVGGAAQPNANAKVLGDIRMLIPIKQIQIEFDNIVSKVLDQKEILQIQNQKLKQARDLLLPKLMSGEVEV